MNKKGQSAIEYLMTYGWALIVIAIVVGILVFVLSNTSGGATCQSRSQKIILKEYAVDPDTVALGMQNATGSDMTSITYAGAGDFGGTGSTAGTITSGSEFTVTTNNLTGPGAGEFTDGVVTITYSTSLLTNQDVNIVCSGSL